MRIRYLILLHLVIALLNMGCSGTSPNRKGERAEALSLQAMRQNPDVYAGRNVLLGGYIIETRRLNGETLVSVTQAPLYINKEPKSKDLSEGRFVFLYRGELASSSDLKDRKVTVTGKVIGVAEADIEYCPQPCLQIEGQKINLWPDESAVNLRPWPSYPFNSDSFSID